MDKAICVQRLKSGLTATVTIQLFHLLALLCVSSLIPMLELLPSVLYPTPYDLCPMLERERELPPLLPLHAVG